MPENKADLAQFLSEQLICKTPNHALAAGKEIVVSGGFEAEDEVKSSNAAIDLNQLKVCHRDADTRLILHTTNLSDIDLIVIQARAMMLFYFLLLTFIE